MRTMRVGKHTNPTRYSVFLLIALLAGSAGCARRYRVEGLVLKVDAPARTMLVSHRAIPGYMPAMAMPFEVERAAELRGVQPGARVEFELKVARHRAVARRVRVRDVRNEGVEGFRFPIPQEQLAVGAEVPDFALTSQTGERVHLQQWRGRVVVVNFLYTRCPLPEVCPRLAATFLSVQRRFREQIPDELELVSITLDPGYDTPPVLAAYAKSIGARWRFLTGTEEEIRRVARRFGLIHWAEEGVLVHTSATAVIDRQGRLVALVEGSGYRLEQLVDLIRESLER